MIRIEAKGKTIDDAINAAVEKAGVDRDLLTIQVLQTPSKGFFGMGSVEAKVLVTYEEKISDKARDFLYEIFEKMGVNAKIEVTEKENEIILNVVGSDVGIVIGRRGETLDALQYLVSLCVNKGKEDYHKITIDAENYREKREQTLQKLAKKLGSKVLSNRRSVTLEAMNPNERRIIHATLQGTRGISTTSIGTEPNRRVVISYVNENRYDRNKQER